MGLFMSSTKKAAKPTITDEDDLGQARIVVKEARTIVAIEKARKGKAPNWPQEETMISRKHKLSWTRKEYEQLISCAGVSIAQDDMLVEGVRYYTDIELTVIYNYCVALKDGTSYDFIDAYEKEHGWSRTKELIEAIRECLCKSEKPKKRKTTKKIDVEPLTSKKNKSTGTTKVSNPKSTTPVLTESTKPKPSLTRSTSIDFNSLINSLVFEGGGVLGVAYCGAMLELEKKIDMENIRIFAGSSAGSIMAAALACRTSIVKIQKILAATDFKSFMDDDVGVVRDIGRLVKDFGWHKGDALQEWAEKMMKTVSGNKDLTFSQCRRAYASHLIITVCKVTKRNVKTMYLDYMSAPDMKIADAIRMSAGIPIFFSAIRDHDSYPMVDGGTLDNYPIGNVRKFVTADEIIGFRLASQMASIGGSPPIDELPEDLIEYVTSIAMATREQALRQTVPDDCWERTIEIDTFDYTSTQFSLTPEDVDRLVKSGRKAVKDVR